MSVVFSSIRDFTFASVRKLGKEQNIFIWLSVKGHFSLVAPELPIFIFLEPWVSWKLFSASVLLICHFLSDSSASGIASKLSNESRGKIELNMGKLLYIFTPGSCPLKMQSKRSLLYFYPVLHSEEDRYDFFKKSPIIGRSGRPLWSENLNDTSEGTALFVY